MAWPWSHNRTGNQQRHIHSRSALLCWSIEAIIPELLQIAIKKVSVIIFCRKTSQVLEVRIGSPQS